MLAQHDEGETMKPLVIYHADCDDGFGAAFAAQAESHAHIFSKLAEQYKSDPVLFAALTDAAAIIRDLLRGRPQALEALKAENEMLREVLKDADNDLDWLDEDMDTCDHSVGVCMCSYWGMRRKMKAALEKENSND